MLKRIRHNIEWGHGVTPMGTKPDPAEEEHNPLLSKFQIAYRPLHSALDHLTILHHQIQLAEQKGEKLYICFMDYKKFYDKCSRSHMWTTFFGMGFIRGAPRWLSPQYSLRHTTRHV